jgi:hypothetical protein
VRPDRKELMTEGADSCGDRDDHLDRVRHAGRRHPPQLLSVCVINSVAASDARGGRRDGSETRGTGDNEVDNSQLTVRARMEPGPDHDRVCADTVSGRGGGLYRLSDHGRRHHQSAHHGRRQSLICAGREPADASFLPDQPSLATRGCIYELDDQACPTVSKPAGSNDDRIRVDPGDHRNRRRVTLQDFRNYPSIALSFHRQFALDLARSLVQTASDNRLAIRGAPAIELARAPVRIRSDTQTYDLGNRIG